MRKLATVTLAGALAVALVGCSSSSEEPSQSSQGEPQLQTSSPSTSQSSQQGAADLSSVKVDHTSKTEIKTSFKTPVKGSSTRAKTVNKGEGATLKKGQIAKLRLALYDAETGKEAQPGNYENVQSLPLDQQSLAGLDQLYDELLDSRVGADVALFITSPNVEKPQVWVVHVDDAQEPPVQWKKSKADTAKSEKSQKLQVKQKKDDTFDVTIPAADPPKDLQVDVLKKGTKGPKATKSSKLTINYAGATWKDAQQFDGNFGSDPTTMGLDQVIEGWTKGLSGVKAGSTVALTIPGDMAYGDDASGDSPSGTLVFIVDIKKVEN